MANDNRKFNNGESSNAGYIGQNSSGGYIQNNINSESYLSHKDLEVEKLERAIEHTVHEQLDGQAAMQQLKDYDDYLELLGINGKNNGYSTTDKNRLAGALHYGNEDIVKLVGDSDYRTKANSSGNLAKDIKHNEDIINRALEDNKIFNAKELNQREVDTALRTGKLGNVRLNDNQKALLKEKRALMDKKLQNSASKYNANKKNTKFNRLKDSVKQQTKEDDFSATKGVEQAKEYKDKISKVTNGVGTAMDVVQNAHTFVSVGATKLIKGSDAAAKKKQKIDNAYSKVHVFRNAKGKISGSVEQAKSNFRKNKKIKKEAKYNNKLVKAERKYGKNSNKYKAKKIAHDKKIKKLKEGRKLFSETKIGKVVGVARTIKNFNPIQIIRDIILKFYKAIMLSGFLIAILLITISSLDNSKNSNLPETLDENGDIEEEDIDVIELETLSMPSSKDNAVSKSYYIYNKVKELQTAYIENLYNAGANSDYNSYSIPDSWKTKIEELDGYSNCSDRVVVNDNGSFVGFNLSKFYSETIYNGVDINGATVKVKGDVGLTNIDLDHDLAKENADNISIDGNTQTIKTSVKNENSNSANNIIISTHFPDESNTKEMITTIIATSVLVNGANADEDTHVQWCQDIYKKLLDSATVTVSTEIVDSSNDLNFYYNNAQHSTKSKDIIINIDINYTAVTSMSQIIEDSGIELSDTSQLAYDMIFSDFTNDEYAELLGLGTPTSDSMSNQGYSKTYTTEEINEIINNQAGLNANQQAILKTAIEAAGQISYYYGGKPTASGYPVMTTVGENGKSAKSADSTGRTIAGLDCFGFVDWAYWTAFNNRILSIGSTTSTTTVHDNGAEGLTRISASEMKPGDLAFLRGHVGIYIGKDEEGHNIFCHCEGGGGANSDKVVVNTYAEWTAFYHVNYLD